MSKAMDKSLFYKAKEKIGQPWTYTKATKEKIAADMEKGTVTARLAPEYDTSPSQGSAIPKPKKTKPFQQLNGRRSQCLGYKADFKVGNERNLQPLPPDFVELAKKNRARCARKKNFTTRKSPC